MSYSTVIDVSVNKKQILVKYDTYWGLALGFVIQNEPRDISIYILLPFIAFEIEIDKEPKGGKKI